MARTLIVLALIMAASMTPASVPLLTETAAGPTARGAAARAFTDELVADLVWDLDAELEMGWRTPSMERFRDRLVRSSGVIDTVLMLGRIMSSGELLDRAVRPSPIRESALRVIVRIACHRQAVAAAELSAVVIPDGPDRYEELQPRPQRGGAVGGTFSEFHSEEERAEYERNAALLQRRLQFKVLKTRLELELRKTEREFGHLMRGIDWLSDADGKALLRRLLAEAGTPDADYLRLAGLPESED